MYYTIIPPCLLFFCCVVLMVVLPIQARARADHLWCGWRFVLRILGERLAANGENWSTAMVRITCLLMVIFCCHDEACLLEAAWSFPLHVLSASSEVLKSHSFFFNLLSTLPPFYFSSTPSWKGDVQPSHWRDVPVAGGERLRRLNLPQQPGYDLHLGCVRIMCFLYCLSFFNGALKESWVLKHVKITF